jgi:hypothetical protein
MRSREKEFQKLRERYKNSYFFYAIEMKEPEFITEKNFCPWIGRIGTQMVIGLTKQSFEKAVKENEKHP